MNGICVRIAIQSHFCSVRFRIHSNRKTHKEYVSGVNEKQREQKKKMEQMKKKMCAIRKENVEKIVCLSYIHNLHKEFQEKKKL